MLGYIVLVLNLLVCSVFAGEIELVAVTHPQCPVCTSWHKDIYADYSIKSKIYHYPKLLVKDYSSTWDRSWVRVNIKKPLEGFPAFFLTDGDQVLSQFVGYSTMDNFYERLEKGIADSK